HGYSPAIVTGKPLDLGGAPGREAATGRGVVFVLAAAAKHWGIDLATSRVVIQGFGNVGSWAARTLHEQGVPVIAISDQSGGILRKTGIDIDAATAWSSAGRLLQDFSGGDRVTNEQLLERECDVL